MNKEGEYGIGKLLILLDPIAIGTGYNVLHTAY